MSEQIEIYIETLTGVSFEIQVCPCESIGSIKAKIQYFEGIPISQQHLIWKNQELDDKACFQDYNIADGSTLKLVLGLRGGPINTKRVGSNSLTKIARLICDTDLIDSEDSNPFTLIVFQDGPNIRMYTIVNSEEEEQASSDSIHSSPSAQVHESSEETQINKENESLYKKMASLQSRMKDLTLSRKAKLSKNINTLPSNLENNPISIDPNIPSSSSYRIGDRLLTPRPLQTPSEKLSQCTSTLKAMGIKLPARTSNLISQHSDSPPSVQRVGSFTTLTYRKPSSATSSVRPRTSPQIKDQTQQKPIISRKHSIQHTSKYTKKQFSKKLPLTPLRIPPMLLKDGLSPLPATKKRKTVKRCLWCRRKLGLATCYTCRCGKEFCSTHRYAEAHDCTYDYKSEGRRHLHVAHPPVKAPKLPKI
ncbi:ZFAND4 [Cordylochernes scorpioides]|uniref:ZFAND4 n=1 Tax=Cordylochernes scorpioides TaxID=51811 RepID=A0ABY6LL34_9ARAC|nr:ZFAND4 [Cordylochernes scorpioides]